MTAMVQPSTARGKKGPPKFQHLPKARGTLRVPLSPAKNSHERDHPAKQLRSAWVQTRKIKSKWNAEKRREGIRTEPPQTASAVEIPVSSVSDIQAGQTLNHQPQPIDVNTGSNTSPSPSEEHPAKASSSQTMREPVPTSKKAPTKGSSQQKDRRSGRHDRRGRPSEYQGKKPSMRNQMNALLEKIQRDID